MQNMRHGAHSFGATKRLGGGVWRGEVRRRTRTKHLKLTRSIVSPLIDVWTAPPPARECAGGGGSLNADKGRLQFLGCGKHADLGAMPRLARGSKIGNLV